MPLEFQYFLSSDFNSNVHTMSIPNAATTVPSRPRGQGAALRNVRLAPSTCLRAVLGLGWAPVLEREKLESAWAMPSGAMTRMQRHSLDHNPVKFAPLGIRSIGKPRPIRSGTSQPGNSGTCRSTLLCKPTQIDRLGTPGNADTRESRGNDSRG